MKSIPQALALGLLVLLAGCAAPRALPPPVAQPLPPVPPPRAPEPSTVEPAPVPKPPVTMAAHPRYAPPPGGNCHWNNELGVYVLERQPGVYYRERSYYRWDAGWFWSSSVEGPWQATDDSEVPPGLGRQHGR